MDYVRSCFKGFWRFFPNQPRLVTPGFLYFAQEDIPTIAGPHPFGSGYWSKEFGYYPTFPVGHDPYLGYQYYDGRPPEPVPPDNQIFPTQDFATDFRPAVPPVPFRNGFDARCWIVQHPGVDIDLDALLRPDVVNCCWQRGMAALLYRLTDPYPTALDDFRAAVSALWGPDATVIISPPDTAKDRFALIVTATFQVLFRVGTQEWTEIFEQSWHGLQAPHNYGTFSTSPVWYDESTRMMDTLNSLHWNPDLRLTIIGHSKGGAIAWITARRMLVANANRQIDVLTYACPKIGDERMIEQDGIANARHVIHRQDIVPLMPYTPALVPILNTVLQFLNLEPAATWRNFATYQICGDGFGNGIGQAEALPWQDYAAFIPLVLTGRAPPAIQQHYLSSYVAALADCCDEPTFPMNNDFWTILFGTADNRNGGGMWGGKGDAPKNAGPLTGLEIGGQGGVISDDWILQEDFYPILDESGDPIRLEI